MASAYEQIKALFARRPDITAVFAIADSMGIAALKALHEEGWKVPEDCSVIAIDGIEVSLYTVPTLTTLVQPTEEIGIDAVRILTGVIEGNNKTEHVYLTTMLREGGTLGPVPR